MLLNRAACSVCDFLLSSTNFIFWEMPEAKSLQWPVNLIEDKTYRNKSIYVSDYCTRTKRIPERRRAKTKETPARYAKDIVRI